MGSIESQPVNHRPLNLPAELKVEIVDCLSVENAAHFLANVPSRLVIHHCALRVRRMLKMIDQIATGYEPAILPTPYFSGYIYLHNGHQYTPELDIFLRYGLEHCHTFEICRGTIDGGFVGYPVNFFDDLIKHYYETRVPEKAVGNLDIALPKENPGPWPAVLVQPQAGEMNVEESRVHNVWKFVVYTLRNKHNPSIEFKLRIDFEGGAKCYQQMTGFGVYMTDVPAYRECSIL